MALSALSARGLSFHRESSYTSYYVLVEARTCGKVVLSHFLYSVHYKDDRLEEYAKEIVGTVRAG